MKKVIPLIILFTIIASILISCTCEHEYYKTITEAPTCSETGIAEYKCTKCGNSYSESIAATGNHKYKEEITKLPDCTHDGEKKFVCEVCGISYNEAIKGGHDFAEATCTMPQKCKVCGKTQGSELGHTTENGKCERCGITFYNGWSETDCDAIIKAIDEIGAAYNAKLRYASPKNSSFLSKARSVCNTIEANLAIVENIINENKDFKFYDSTDGKNKYIKAVLNTAINNAGFASSVCSNARSTLDCYDVFTYTAQSVKDCYTLSIGISYLKIESIKQSFN